MGTRGVCLDFTCLLFRASQGGKCSTIPKALGFVGMEGEAGGFTEGFTLLASKWYGSSRRTVERCSGQRSCLL